MSRLHLASEEQLIFVGEMLGVVQRVQTDPRDDHATTREWLAQTVDALADLAACYDELHSFSSALRRIAREEGGHGVEDTDGEGEQLTPTRRKTARRNPVAQVVNQPRKRALSGGRASPEIADVSVSEEPQFVGH